MKILILFAHPAFHKSNTNKYLVQGLDSIEDVTFHDLYEQYPEFDIDVSREQELLEAHDCIVFQNPFFWYSTPAILKEWQDLVLEHGWAFGSKGNALKGKLFFNVLSAGGPKSAYQKGNFHNHTINELIAPLKQTFILCKMISLPPFVVHGTHAIDKEELEQFRKDYFDLLDIIKNDQINIDKALTLEYLNDYKN